MAHRFFVLTEFILEGRVNFTDAQNRQIKTVLRLKEGDEVAVFDGSGKEYHVLLESRGGRIVGETRPQVEPEIGLTLVQSLPKGEKIDWILQKCTEIGVSKFLFVESARSVPRIPADKLQGRLSRWRAIVKEAAEQSGRIRLPEVEGVIAFEEAFAEAAGKVGLIAWEGEKNRLINSELKRASCAKEMVLFTGPEGGFTLEEAEAAEKAGIIPVSLGPRILRAETAAIVVSALVLY